MIKYILTPGTMFSCHDGQDRFINVRQLAKLYQLDHDSYVVAHNEIETQRAQHTYPNALVLGPRYLDNYNIKEQSNTYNVFSCSITRAVREFAVMCHGSHKYGNKPYVCHLDAVMDILNQHYQNSAWAVQLAYLHDVVEDTAHTVEDIKARYGGDIAAGVAFLTDVSGPNRKSRKAATYLRARTEIDAELAKNTFPGENPVLNPITETAVWVKLADRLANARESQNNPGLLKMYRNEHESFYAAYSVYSENNMANPPPQNMWSIWLELASLLNDA